jgi:ribosomal protein L21
MAKKKDKKSPTPAPSPEPEPEKEVKKPAKDSILPKKIVTTKKPAPKKEKEKPAAREKYTRTRAVAETILENMKANPDDIIQLADDLFVRKGGKANIRHSRVQYNIIKQVLEIFNIL